MPGKIISLVNFKGGVGKSILTVNLAACLEKENAQDTVVVDLDLQSSSSIRLLAQSPSSFLKLRGELS
jgi:chromosome partitioning protein